MGNKINPLVGFIMIAGIEKKMTNKRENSSILSPIITFATRYEKNSKIINDPNNVIVLIILFFLINSKTHAYLSKLVYTK